MKTQTSIIFIFLTTLCFSGVFAQENNNPYDVNFKIDYNRQAQYPEGDEAFYAYIFKNISYSEEAKKNNASGNVLVSFDVETDSTLTNIIVLSSPGYGTDKEIVRLLTPLKFVPAVVNGQLIKQNMMLTIPVRAGAGSN